jgi:hypothetical protein
VTEEGTAVKSTSSKLAAQPEHSPHPRPAAPSSTSTADRVRASLLLVPPRR